MHCILLCTPSWLLDFHHLGLLCLWSATPGGCNQTCWLLLTTGGPRLPGRRLLCDYFSPCPPCLLRAPPCPGLVSDPCLTAV
jgi:hypothetical protein